MHQWLVGGGGVAPSLLPVGLDHVGDEVDAGDHAAALLGEGLRRYTETTITDLGTLTSELAGIRAHGYAVSVGEMEPSLFGVSAAVRDPRDRPIAVLSIWGPRDRVPESRFPTLGTLATKGAEEIATALH